jgi:hypothetical protein
LINNILKLSSFFSQLIKQIETKRLSKTFAQLLYLASISQLDLDRQICSIRNCENQQRNVLLLTNVPDLSMLSIGIVILYFASLVSVTIDWNLSECTTSDVEDLVSTIDPFVYLREVDRLKICLINPSSFCL